MIKLGWFVFLFWYFNDIVIYVWKQKYIYMLSFSYCRHCEAGGTSAVDSNEPHCRTDREEFILTKVNCLNVKSQTRTDIIKYLGQLPAVD